MADARFRAGDRVRTDAQDPWHHTRLPRYARGHEGEVLDVHGAWPPADERARAVADPATEPVYTVRFAARDLWGAGDHWVTLDLWDRYLAPAHDETNGEAP